MSYNRGDIRDYVLSLAPWQVSANDTSFLARVNNAIKLGYNQLAEEVPEALFPDEEHVVLLGDQTDTTMGKKLSATADPWVLTWGLAAGFTVDPVVDGTWDGVYHIEVQDPDGTWHRRQCREFFQAGVPSNAYVTLDRPWRNTTDANMTYRLHQPEVYLADDVTKVIDGSIWDGTRQLMLPLPEGFFRFHYDVDFRGSQKSRPMHLARHRHVQLDAPNRAIQVATDQDNPWVGPEPLGNFEYAFTYCWGVRDLERRMPGESATGYPMMESSPSPVSSAFTTTGNRIVLTLPDIDFQLNFNRAGTTRAGHSGIYKRIYRRRNSVTGGANQTIERPSIWQYLGDVSGEVTTYYDDGSVIPDYLVRMPESSGYYVWIPHPHQDTRYELDVRVLRRPRALENDSDAPRVSPDAIPALLEYVAHYVARMDNDAAAAAARLQAAREAAAAFRARYASPAAVVPSEPWGAGNFPPYRTPYLGRMSSQ